MYSAAPITRLTQGTGARRVSGHLAQVGDQGGQGARAASGGVDVVHLDAEVAQET